MKLKAAFLKLILLIIMSATFPGLRAQPSTADPDYACINSTEDYWVTNTPGSTYNWVLSGGGTITQGQGSNAIRINWTTTGTFSLTVTETLSSTSNCTGAPVSLNIIVDPLPVPTATANSPFTGGDLNLIGGPDGMASYAWTGPNGFSSTEQNPVITGVTEAAAGTYSLTVTNSAGCSASTTVDVTINTVDLPTAVANTPCVGGDLILIGGPSGMTSYSWAGPNGFTSTEQNPVITGVTDAAAGTYTLTVTNSAGCSASTTVNVTINTVDLPTAVANTPCVGGDLILIGGPSGMASYSWSGPNGFSSTEQNPIITGVTAAAAGTYTLTVTNAGGGTASTTVDVVINPLPSPVITGPNPVCQSINGSTEIYSTPAHAGSTYNWTIVGGTLSGQGTNQITVLWTTPGIGSVSVTETVTNTGCTATATIEINVQPAPVTSRIYHN